MTTGTVIGVLLVPVVVPALAALCAAVFGWRRWVAWGAVTASAALLVAGIAMAAATNTEE